MIISLLTKNSRRTCSALALGLLVLVAEALERTAPGDSSSTTTSSSTSEPNLVLAQSVAEIALGEDSTSSSGFDDRVGSLAGTLNSQEAFNTTEVSADKSVRAGWLRQESLGRRKPYNLKISSDELTSATSVDPAKAESDPSTARANEPGTDGARKSPRGTFAGQNSSGLGNGSRRGKQTSGRPSGRGDEELLDIDEESSRDSQPTLLAESASSTSGALSSANEVFSGASPLAYSLLYRVRDLTNPLTFANFLAEGAEWHISGGREWFEGLGRRVDSLFTGLFLKTARVLPDYKRNVIVSYKQFRPSMWVEMLGLRNQFLQKLATLFHRPQRMQSVYLRNLGMEIFEVPSLWQVGEFVAAVLSMPAYVSHVHTDALLTDFDVEAQNEEGAESDEAESLSFSPPPSEAAPSTRPSPSLRRTWPKPRGSAAAARRLDVMTNDPYTWQQWAVIDSGASRWGVEAPKAWEVWTGAEAPRRFVVAVIDSGVDVNHPDLRNRIWRNPGEICGNGIDDDLNGFVDDCFGWDFVDGTALPLDENGHGTASAGIIAAEPNNGIGLTGLCWGCEIMVLKALNKEIKGTVSSFTRSLDYAIGKGVKLSNNSYGGRGAGFKGLEEAVERARQAGMIMVAAAGNYNGNNDNDKQPVFPASYPSDNVVAVAAIDRDGQLASFSSYGRTHVDIAAPGSNIMTTSVNKTYRRVNGTSFAVPMVTGVLGLLWTKRPDLSYQQIIQRVLRSAKKNPALEGLIATEGTVDAFRALTNEDSPPSSPPSSVLPQASAPVSAVYDPSRLPGVSAFCSLDEHCAPHGRCVDVGGVGGCVCKEGFQGNGGVCEDVDECLFEPCGVASVCVNTVGSYYCRCLPGFEQTPDACLDIDECALGAQGLLEAPCPPEALCKNFSGTYDCLCPIGSVWNALSGAAGKCIQLHSPLEGVCAKNGGCGANALCRTPSPLGGVSAGDSRVCECVSGYKSLAVNNPQVAAALRGPAGLLSFDSSVCVRSTLLEEEQAFYLYAMQRARGEQQQQSLLQLQIQQQLREQTALYRQQLSQEIERTPALPGLVTGPLDPVLEDALGSSVVASSQRLPHAAPPVGSFPIPPPSAPLQNAAELHGGASTGGAFLGSLYREQSPPEVVPASLYALPDGSRAVRQSASACFWGVCV